MRDSSSLVLGMRETWPHTKLGARAVGNCTTVDVVFVVVVALCLGSNGRTWMKLRTQANREGHLWVIALSLRVVISFACWMQVHPVLELRIVVFTTEAIPFLAEG